MLRRLALAIVFWPLLAQAISLGPAHAVTPRTPGLAAGSQDDAALATSGRETLAAWNDETLGREGVYVAQLGVPEKQRWLVQDGAFSFALTWTGESYLVLWFSRSTSDLWAMTIDRELATRTPARRIHADGGTLTNVVWIGDRGAVVAGRTLLVIDREANIVASVANVLADQTLENVRMAASEDAFAVFLHQRQNDQSILLAQRYGTSGTALDAAPVEIGRMPKLREDWDVAFGGDRFALVATESNAYFLWRFLTDATTLQTQVRDPLPIGKSSGAHVEWVGDRFVALWLDQSGEIVSLRTHTLGGPLTEGSYGLRMVAFTESTESAVVAARHYGGSAVHPDATWNGTNLTIAYTFTPSANTRDIYVESADWRTGQTTTRSPVSRSMQWQSIAAASTDGRTALVAWLEGDPDRDIMRLAITRVTAGAMDSPLSYLSDSAWPSAPVVVATSSMDLVFWLEHSERGSDLAMQRVRRDGVLLDATRTNLGSCYGAGAAWNSTYVLVACATPIQGGTRAIRLGDDGRVIDAVPISLPAPDEIMPVAVASNGSDFMIVWTEGNDSEFPSPNLLDLHAARITAAGVAGPAFPIATGPANQRDATIASDGRDYLVVYAETPPDGEATIVTKKILQEGALAATTASAPGTPLASLSRRLKRAPSIASTTHGYVVTWEEEDFPSSAIHIAALDREGASIETPATIAESDVSGIAPAIVTGSSRTAGYLFYSLLEDEPEYGTSMRLLLRQFGEIGAKRRSVRR